MRDAMEEGLGAAERNINDLLRPSGPSSSASQTTIYWAPDERDAKEILSSYANPSDPEDRIFAKKNGLRKPDATCSLCGETSANPSTTLFAVDLYAPQHSDGSRTALETPVTVCNACIDESKR
ncbi:hypothetical protein Q5752_005605 [Cryptotrichosporon argae]